MAPGGAGPEVEEQRMGGDRLEGEGALGSHRVAPGRGRT